MPLNLGWYLREAADALLRGNLTGCPSRGRFESTRHHISGCGKKRASHPVFRVRSSSAAPELNFQVAILLYV